MTDRYRFDPSRSRFTVDAFATGLLSFAGHSPSFAVRDYAGELRFEAGEAERIAIELTADADSLEVRGHASASDRREIETRMRREVLETAAHPRITYRSEDVSAETIARGRHRLRVAGRLTLRGVTLPHPIDAELRVFEDGLQLLGACALRLSDYRIGPVTALGGAIKLKDQVELSFDLIGLPEGP